MLRETQPKPFAKKEPVLVITIILVGKKTIRGWNFDNIFVFKDVECFTTLIKQKPARIHSVAYIVTQHHSKIVCNNIIKDKGLNF